MTETKKRRWLRRYGRYVVGICAFGWLAARLDLEASLSVVSRIPGQTLVMVFVVSIGGYLALFASWHVLFRQFADTKFVDAASVSLSLAFLNLSVPTRLPATVVNPLLITNRTSLEGGEATAITLFQITIFAGCYGVVTILGIARTFTQLSKGLVLVLAGSAVLYFVVFLGGSAAGLGFDLVDRLLEWVGSVPKLGQVIGSTAPSFGTTVQSGFRSCLTNAQTVGLYIACWAGSVMVASGARFWLLFQALDVTITDPALLPVYAVMAYAVTILPISIGGIGVAEASAVLVFSSLGFPIEVVAPVVLVDRIFASYLPGVMGVYTAVRTGLPVSEEG